MTKTKPKNKEKITPSLTRLLEHLKLLAIADRNMK